MSGWEIAGVVAVVLVGIVDALVTRVVRAMHERSVLRTPGVREGVDAALVELAHLRSRGVCTHPARG